ncbi:MAG: hypothetical protein AAGF66_08270 [Cyanobacteria bacterium P01_H01_bin.119]
MVKEVVQITATKAYLVKQFFGGWVLCGGDRPKLTRLGKQRTGALSV